MSFIDEIETRIEALRAEIAPAIAEGIRTHAARPASERGSPQLQFGNVAETFPDQGYASVMLDGQTTSTAAMILQGVTVGERVAVLFYPPSGTLVLGQVAPAAASTGIPAGGASDTFLGKVSAADYDVAWLPVAASFPVGPFDDGTATYEIQTRNLGGAGFLTGTATLDSDTHLIATWLAEVASSGLTSALIAQDTNHSYQGEVGTSITGTTEVKSAMLTSGFGSSAAIQVRSHTGGGQFIEIGQADEHVSICAGTAGQSLGFFGAVTVPQQPTPVILADVIALLQAYGLCP